ncbi:hypothetical protein EOM09_09265 [bacterium]|nr:hypothetical protein [bacterium]
MTKKIVIINGNGGVGKDFFTDLCGKYKKIKKISTVDKVKEAAKVLVSYNNEKDEKTRKLLSDLKILAEEYNGSIIKYLENSIKEFKNDENELLFLFVREIKDIVKIKNVEKDIITLLITNKNKKFITSNIADRDVLNYKYDYTIENTDTIEELEEKAKEFIKEIYNEQ